MDMGFAREPSSSSQSHQFHFNPGHCKTFVTFNFSKQQNKRFKAQALGGACSVCDGGGWVCDWAVQDAVGLAMTYTVSACVTLCPSTPAAL